MNKTIIEHCFHLNLVLSTTPLCSPFLFKVDTVLVQVKAGDGGDHFFVLVQLHFCQFSA